MVRPGKCHFYIFRGNPIQKAYTITCFYPIVFLLARIFTRVKNALGQIPNYFLISEQAVWAGPVVPNKGDSPLQRRGRPADRPASRLQGLVYLFARAKKYTRPDSELFSYLGEGHSARLRAECFFYPPPPRVFFLPG